MGALHLYTDKVWLGKWPKELLWDLLMFVWY